ncbi:MAG: ribulose-bisphosphate carboxylase large subunit family protein [Verrucomicrobiota bacterium]|nr:ribulose-bisphosphate carboxylase large subunit family protein [Verrucomicrobiota bacterium]
MTPSGRIRATYLIETAHSLEKAAATMAGEQSSGTFTAVPGETDELKAAHGGVVERITVIGTADAPALPGSRQPKGGRLQQAEVELSFPVANINPSVANLWTLVAGNLFELSPFSGLRLLDIDVPDDFASLFPGPAFGVEGTRRLAGVYERPLIGTIIKPSVGLSPEATAELVKTLIEAGLDFIKDDELIANPPYSTLADRVKAVMSVINAHADRTGRKPMYAFNISDECDEMRRHHDTVLAHGGTCVMVNMLSVGASAVSALRKHAALPIHGHRNGWGMLSRCPMLGMDYTAYHKLMRLAGVDHFHVNGLRNKFCEADTSSITSARACLKPWAGTRAVMPVFSSGQTASQAHDTHAALNSTDLMYLCGGGILGHPSGPKAGVESVQLAWDAAIKGIPLADMAEQHSSLKQALSALKHD